MKKITTAIDGVVKIELVPHIDSRGVFTKWFSADYFEGILNGREIVQANHSVNVSRGSIRGMHYQDFPYPETKLIRCIKGKVFDVVVDLRRGSKTYLSWVGVELSENDDILLVVPEGCAHGFQVLQDDSELLYLHSNIYSPEAERGIRYDDPELKIDWPLPATEVSEKDKGYAFIDGDFGGVKSKRVKCQ